MSVKVSPILAWLRDLAVLMLGTTTVLFFLLRLTGDSAVVLAGPDATEAQLGEIRVQYGLDRALPLQYVSYIASLLRLEFGHSLADGTPALTKVLSRMIEANVSTAMDSAYVRTARAIGASDREILWRHALPTALDATVQLQILALLKRSVGSGAMVLITHDLGVAATMCDRIVVMHRGQCVEEGSAARILDVPRHPYTRQLLSAAQSLTRPGDASRVGGMAQS